MKPNVLITIDTYAIGGPGKLILQFLKNGGRGNCAPVVAGFWRGPDREWQFRDAVVKLGVPFAVFRQKFAFDPMVIGAAYRLTRDCGTQVLESHGYKSHVVCLALKKLRKVPWVAYVHGWTSENLKVDLYNRLEKNIVRFADRIVPVSRDLGTRLRLGRHDRGKLVYIPNAVEPVDPNFSGPDVRKELGLRDGDLLLGVVGRLSPEKGHRYFIEAFRSLAATHSNVRAVFVGQGQEREALATAIRDKGLEKRITLAGYQEDVYSYYRACDIIVLPSLREGMPMAALEAMTFGKPVVASNVGGIPEVVQDGTTGLLVEPANPAALTDALSGLLSEPAKMRILGCAGRERIESEFNPLARTDKIVELYRQLLVN